MKETNVCVGTVVRKDSRILLVRQGEGHSLQHQWTIPWGRLQDGESPPEAALRETREEAGVESEMTGLLGVQELPAPQEGWMALIFLAHHVDGTPTGDGRETDAAMYFSEHDLDALREPVEPFSDWLVRRVFDERHSVVPANPENPFAPHRAFI